MQLTPEQIEELNKKINELYLHHKAIRVTIDDEDHYISDVSETSAVYLDGSHFEGDLEDMEFADYSPDDGCEFEDFDEAQFETFVKELYDPESVVDIVLMITEAYTDEYGDQDWDLEHCSLRGVICERDDIEDDEKYLAIAEYSPEKECYVIVSYHPTILKGIDERAADVFALGISLAQYEHELKILGSYLILVTLKNCDKKCYESCFERLKMLGLPVQEISDNELLIEYKK